MFDDDEDFVDPAAVETFEEEYVCYLRNPVENVVDVIGWWIKNSPKYPRLSRMGLDYGCIPGKFGPRSLLCTTLIALSATSTEVERVFSRGHLLLSHIRNRLSAQSTRAVLCLGYWSQLGLVEDEDVLQVTMMEEEAGNDPNSDVKIEDGWDDIVLFNSSAEAW
jgi:hypothetical protein